MAVMGLLHMRRIKHSSKRIATRFLGIAAVALTLVLPANLLGESLVRTVSLEATGQDHDIRVPVRATITFNNNYPQTLYETSVLTDRSDKKMLGIGLFPSGQSFGLEFLRKGPYSVCYSLSPKTDSTNTICLQIDVVPLQTA